MKIKNVKARHLLFVILILAAVLRLWKLGSIPPHLTSDEAALGFNAYSILKTGRDEHGALLPIIFKSFGDFKPGLYVYTAVPFVALLGLTEYAVRLPSAIFGVAAVWLIYAVVRQLFEDKKDQKVAIFAALLLAINPWHIHFSRGAWEINLSLTLALAGIYFFFKSFEKQKFLLLSTFSFALTLVTYQGAKLSTGIIVLVLLALYWKRLVKFDRKVLTTSFVLGTVIALPIIASLFTGRAGRLTVFSVFSYPRGEVYLQDFLDQGKETIGSLNYYAFHSEANNFGRGVLGRWFNHFSTRFLFFEGDWKNLRHAAPNHGMLLVGDLVLLAVGAIVLIKKGAKKQTLFIWAWLLLAPLPSALSRDQVHAVRAFNMIAPLTVIAAFGAAWVYDLKKTRWVFLALYVAGFVYFLDAFFLHLPVNRSRDWQYGYKQIVEVVAPIQDNYKTVKVPQSFSQPYIYFLFYNPDRYVGEPVDLRENEFGDVGLVDSLGNIEFTQIDWPADRGASGTLLVGDYFGLPERDTGDNEKYDEIAEIKYLDGAPAYRVVGVK